MAKNTAKKLIQIAVDSKKTIALDKLEPFQDDLKTLSKEKYEKMRENILEYGFSFAVHVWQNKGKNYIIDGHQRVFTIKQLVEVEGYEAPEIPVVLVEAKTLKQAKLKVLAGASQYGEMKESGLEKFLKENQIDINKVAAQFDFVGMDFDSFYKKFLEQESDIILPEPEEFSGQGMASSSSQVKQVQLLFSVEAYEEFSKKTEVLSKVYKTENITDTIIEAVREIYKAKNPKSK